MRPAPSSRAPAPEIGSRDGSRRRRSRRPPPPARAATAAGRERQDRAAAGRDRDLVGLVPLGDGAAPSADSPKDPRSRSPSIGFGATGCLGGSWAGSS